MVEFEAPGVVLHYGDCIEVMRTLPDASVDAVVTDPPYGLEFMGKEWDGANGFRRSLNEADAGRENVFGRTSQKAHEYKTGRPVVLGQISDGDKSRGPLPTGKGTHSRGFADHDANAFQAWCQVWAAEALRILKPGGHMVAFGGARTWHRLAVAVEDAGFEIRDSIAWLYGSGFPKHPNVLKPAFEPIVVGRKTLIGTVAANVEKYGTGALNIDANRTPATDSQLAEKYASVQKAGSRENSIYGADTRSREGSQPNEGGRWPTNVLLDEAQAAALDEQTGVSRSRIGKPRAGTSGDGWGMTATGTEYDDEGGASRYFPTFRYEAKAPTAERPSLDGVLHPTVKPLNLMRWLVRLATPKGGTILEPFAGSGTTLEAALLEGFNVIGIEKAAEYLPLIKARITKPLQVTMFGLDEL